MTPLSREDAADGLREQAASCRRLAVRARTDLERPPWRLLQSSSTLARAESIPKAFALIPLSKDKL